MADVIREALIKLGFDQGEIDKGLQKFKESLRSVETETKKTDDSLKQSARSVDELHASYTKFAGGVAVGLASVFGAYKAVSAIVDEGQAFLKLNTAFQNLYGSATALGKDGLEQLRTALHGTVADVDLLKEANLAAQSGLDPQQFKVVAASAEAFGDILNVGPTEALGELTKALATGNEGLLKRAGIDVDVSKAEKAYADSLGVSVKALDETAKKEAFREAAVKKLAESVKAAGDTDRTAADAVEELNVKLENMSTQFAVLINQSPALVSFIDSLATGFQRLANLDIHVLQDLQEFSLKFTPFAGLFDVAKNKLGIDPLHGIFGDSANGSPLLPDRNTFNEALRQQAIEIEREQKKAAERQRLLTYQADQDREKSAQHRWEVEEISLKQFIDSVNTYLETGVSDGVFAGFEKAIQDVLPGAEFVENVTKANDILRQQFQDSANFFSDALYNAMTGAAFDAKDIMYRILAGVAGGFLASITGNFGANAGSLQGIGQILGATLAGGGGGAGSLSSILGFGTGAAVAGTPNFIGPNQGITAAGVGANVSGLAGLGASGILPLIAIAGTGFLGLQAGQNIASGKKLTDLQQFGLALPTFGASLLPNLLGLGGGGNPDRLARESLLDSLRERLGDDLTFQGARGPLSLNSRNFNVDFSRPNAGATVGLVNPLAQALTGGDDKLGADLAGIFTNAVSGAENFNEVLINVSSLMDGLGVTAPDLKDEISKLWLDGKLSLEEYNASMASLNVISTESLTSASDGLKLVADSTLTPRARIKALELTFKELQEEGVTSAEQIKAKFIDQFGPEAINLFDQLRAAGIDTWEEVANASSDQINFIANLLNGLSDSFQGAFSSSTSSIQRTINTLGDLIPYLDEANAKLLEIRRNNISPDLDQKRANAGQQNGRSVNLNQTGTNNQTG